jgi:hypothetical protein
VDHLHWSDWGSSVAHATGISSASNGIPSIAQGRRDGHRLKSVDAAATVGLAAAHRVAPRSPRAQAARKAGESLPRSPGV